MPEIIAAALGILLLAGLWTPVTGILICAAETWILLSRPADDLWAPLILVALAASVAMIGPGAWSIDARLFGRKHIETSQL
jgi:putative oxidoreductase